FIKHRRRGRDALIATSFTFTRSTRAATSRRGNSRSFTAPNCGQRSDRCTDRRDTNGGANNLPAAPFAHETTIEIRRDIMNTRKETEDIDHDRRRLLANGSIGVAVAGAASLLPSTAAAAPAGDSIRPFRVDVPQERLAELRRRIAATQWPERETVPDQSQGV